MKPRERRKHKGRVEGGGFVLIPWAVMDSEAWKAASPGALALLLEICRQYNGKNNGDLSAAFSILKKRGWTSSGTVSVYLKELRHYGFIVLTRQGGLWSLAGGGRLTSLYAVTWHRVDPCDGKHSYPHGPKPPGLWRQPVEPFKRPKKKQRPAAESGAVRSANRSGEQKKAA